MCLKSLSFLNVAIVFTVLAKSDNSGVVNTENLNEISLNYRLPNETYPEHYNIQLFTNVDTGEKTFQGEVAIDIVVANKIRNIVLHARQLEISNATILNPVSGIWEDLSREYDIKREFLILTRSQGEWFNAATKCYVAGTFFSATNARSAFPCYDEPAKRANFTITINHSPQYTAICNMPVNKALSGVGKTVFLTAVHVPTYLVSFVVSDYEYSERTLNGFPQRIYSRPSAKDKHKFAINSVVLLKEYFSKYLNIEFMLPKLDHVALPDQIAAAMENWGLITYPENLLLYSGPNENEDPATRVALTLAHEIAHQWFGNYVTIQWWTDLWLSEGFATFFSYKALENSYPDWSAWQYFLIECYQKAMDNDADDDSPRPMTHYAQTPDEVMELFDYISYEKSASVLRMWNNALTETVFQKGMQNFLTENNYSAADEEQLFAALQDAVKAENLKIPASVSELMKTWTHQGGFPLLTVNRNYEDGTFSITQESFHHNDNLEEGKTWYVPINYAVASNSDFSDTKATHYLLNVSAMSVADKIADTDWLILNKQSAYYYRIKYDTKNYNLITEYLIERPSTIHTLNRAQLMSDAHNLVRSKRLDHAVLFKMFTYLKKEVEYAPWMTAANILSVYNRFLIENDDYKLYIVELVTDIYRKLGITSIPGEHHLDKFIRKEVIQLACLADVKECLKDTNEKLKDVLENPKSVELNLRDTILSFGLRQSGDNEFNLIFNKLMAKKDVDVNYILYMGYSRNETQINKLLYATIDLSNSLSPEERIGVLEWIYSNNDKGLLLCIEFFAKNWQVYGNLQNTLDDNKHLDNEIRNMASYVVSKKSAEKLLALVHKVENSLLVKPDLETFVKGEMEQALQWQREHAEHIISWISEYRANKSLSEK